MSALHALLIGIDRYMPNQLSDGGYYPDLGGCVRDANEIEAFVRGALGADGANVVKLTATYDGSGSPPEPKETWPTYENIVRAVQSITERAASGEQVFIHYSGHGGRVPTRFPDLKGAAGLDETLVPTDIGESEARYVLDLELAYLLAAMVDKGLLVTISLDSCHSGGATRGFGRVRGIATVDRTVRRSDSLVADDAELRAAWGRRGATRGVAPTSGWLPEPQGYVLLAACRPSESAHEDVFAGTTSSGALTYWMLDTLKRPRAGITYRALMDRVSAKVHGRFADQNPMVEGEGDRVVFGADRIAATGTIPVQRVDGSTMTLGAGDAQGVNVGATFSLHGPTDDVADIATRKALIKVVAVDGTTCKAETLTTLGGDTVEVGDQAALIDAGLGRTSCRVRLGADAAFNSVRQAMRDGGVGVVELADAGGPADLAVEVGSDGMFQILDPAGQPLLNLGAPLVADQPGTAASLVARLVHVGRYLATRGHESDDPALAGGLVVTIDGHQPDYKRGTEPRPVPAPAGSPPTFDPDDFVFVRVANRSGMVLNVTVLDFQPDWGISKVWPTDADWFSLDDGESHLVVLRTFVPAALEGTADPVDLIKVYATVEPTGFGSLLLPALAESARTRNVAPEDPDTAHGWATDAVEIAVRRSARH